MSASKIKDKLKKLDEFRADLVTLVVENTECAFHIASMSDDGGAHFMIYLDASYRDEIDLHNFRRLISEKLGRKRALICFVDNDYIETFLRD